MSKFLELFLRRRRLVHLQNVEANRFTKRPTLPDDHHIADSDIPKTIPQRGPHRPKTQSTRRLTESKASSERTTSCVASRNDCTS